MDKDSKLQDLLNNDPLGLLVVKPESSPARNADERLVASFQEINDFIATNQREPIEGRGIQEHQLFSRLKSIRAHAEKTEMLRSYDSHRLLEAKPSIPLTVDELMENDPLGLLSDDSQGLFDLKHIKPIDKERAATDFVARRKPCKNFVNYEQLFKNVQNDLKDGKRKLAEFKLGHLRQGAFYVHNGIVFLVEQIEISKKEHYKSDGTRVREDGRTRCIFENGTESNMLKRSIEKLLYANGQVITDLNEQANESIVQSFEGITEEDVKSGYIYVLRSKSNNKEIKEIRNLHKIGFSKTTVKERIKNAAQEPTYLMAEVECVNEWECYNMNPQKFEQLLHNFFGKACLNIDVFDKDGKRHSPREGFVAPISIIEQAIDYIINGDIINIRYDPELEEIVER